MGRSHELSSCKMAQKLIQKFGPKSSPTAREGYICRCNKVTIKLIFVDIIATEKL